MGEEEIPEDSLSPLIQHPLRRTGLCMHLNLSATLVLYIYQSHIPHHFNFVSDFNVFETFSFFLFAPLMF